MGRSSEWYNWGRSTRRGGADQKQETSPSPNPGGGGCMSGVLHHLFDFNLSHCVFQHHDQPDEEPKILIKGVEAPRNSLESEQGPVMEASSSLPEIMREEEDLNIPNLQIAIQIKTASETTRPRGGGGLSRVDESSSDSPMAKTPNLVARLMGLDLLPDNSSPNSPSSSSSSSIYRKSISSSRFNHLQERNVCAVKLELRSRSNNLVENGMRYELTGGSHSLPETPRVSSARRSDVDPRLSLQINKENMMIINTDEFDYLTTRVVSTHCTKARKKDYWRHPDQDQENKSPSIYARQIVKQVKESVSRKVGLDITNTSTTRNRSNEGAGIVIKSKRTKGSMRQVGDEASSPSNKHSTLTCSPKLRFLEPKNKPVITTSITNKDQCSQSPRTLSKPIPPTTTLSSSTSSSTDNQSEASTEQQKKKKKQSIQKCKRGSSERFTQRLKATNKANITDKKCRKTPPFIPRKKESSLSNPSPTKILHTQVVVKRNSQLSSCSSQSYKQEATQQLVDRATTTPRTTCSFGQIGTGTEFRYVSEILKRTKIETDTLVSFTSWYSPSHPLNPSIFHHLENSFLDPINLLGSLSHRCNRKLLFHLVDELLVDILKPYLNLKPWLLPSSSANSSIFLREQQMKGFQLLDRLCSRIRRFPSSDCKVLEDIDALVEMDLLDGANVQGGASSFTDESEWILFEIERDLVDSLVHEIATVLDEDK